MNTNIVEKITTRSKCSDNASRAVYAFSADPITNGHINVVERISNTFDQVIVGIGRNPLKKYLFSLEERLSMATEALHYLPNVEVVTFHGMVVDFASEQGANIIVKGIRNATDFDYEQTHHLVGASQQVGIDTHLLFADPALSHVSSSAVKAIQIEHGTLNHYVPLVVKFALESKISQQLIIGVTGEIASGKSILSQQLIQAASEKRIPVHHIDMDKMGHSLLQGEDSPMHKKTRRLVVERFGDDICSASVIDRTLLAAKVFGNPKALADLNAILIKPITILLRRFLYGKQGLVILDGALITEAGLHEFCNNNIVLTRSTASMQKQRLMKRGYSKQQVEDRIAAQWSFTQKKEAVEDAIVEHNYGNLWIRDTSERADITSASTLLDDIIVNTESTALFDLLRCDKLLKKE